MRPVRAALGLWALLLLAAGAGPLQAAWCNVFQVCCHGNRAQPAPAVSAYADACCDPCPQPVCTTRYSVRCYYQPVVSYQTKTYYEPVTTYRTSYYYEPVTTYQSSYYFDPSSCSYKQSCCPSTSYRLRTQSCPVQSWVQRCCSVPVTTYQQAYYYVPETCCSGAPSAAAPGGPPVPQLPTPGVREPPLLPNPGVNEPGRRGNDVRLQVPPGAAPRPATPLPFRPERTASMTKQAVEGQVLRGEQRPQPGARLLFVHADRQNAQETVDADGTGRFRATLTPGKWLVYLYGADGKLDLTRRFEVGEDGVNQLTVYTRP